MIDTIHAYYSFGPLNTDIGNLSNPDLFKKKSEGHIYTLFQSIQYPLLSFKVYFKGDKPARINFEGSIQKVIDGWNIQHNNLLTTKRAIVVINRLIGIENLSFLDFSVTRLDLAANIPVKYPVIYYLSRLTHKPRYVRRTSGTTLYFNSSIKTLCFYDKAIETNKYLITATKSLQRHKAEAIVAKQKHILRYEVRLLKNVYKFFKRKSLLIKDLYDKTIYSQYPVLWHDAYQDISKSKVFIFKPSTKNDVLDYLIGRGINAHGKLDKFVTELENMLNKGVIKGTTKPGLISRIQKAHQNKVVSKEDKSILALDSLIQRRFETLKKKYSKRKKKKKGSLHPPRAKYLT